MPRQPLTGTEVGEPADFSWQELQSFTELLEKDVQPNAGFRKGETPKAAVTGAIKLNDNSFSSWEGFSDAVHKHMPGGQANGVHWIDLSGNCLTSIDDALLQFSNVGSLYLHANSIKKRSEIKKLAGLPNLKSLTLHGNPVETKVKEGKRKEYRYFIISLLPNLRKLDFTPITREDRESAECWLENAKRKASSDR